MKSFKEFCQVNESVGVGMEYNGKEFTKITYRKGYVDPIEEEGILYVVPHAHIDLVFKRKMEPIRIEFSDMTKVTPRKDTTLPLEIMRKDGTEILIYFNDYAKHNAGIRNK